MSGAEAQLVLSIFPGGGVLDHAFELEGFCVVQARDIIMGGDVRSFHPPAGRFDGIIGGDPCQSHSALANLVRAKGLTPSFPDLTPEFERVVNEARPAWFLRENVPQAPDIKPDGYDVRSFLLDNSTLDSGDGTGNEQMRRRRFWFGVRDGKCPELRAFMDFALFELPDAKTAVAGENGYSPREFMKYKDAKRRQQAVAGDAPSVPVALGGSGKRKVTAEDIDYSPPRRTLEEMMRLQGMPEDWFKYSPFKMEAKKKIVGNAVAVPMGRQLARAVREGTG